MKNNLHYFILIFVFGSCFSVKFKEPQPKSGKALEQIPVELLGKFKGNEDTVVIKKNSVIYPETVYNESIPVSIIDSMKNLKIRDNYIYDSNIDSTIPIRYEIANDTLYYYYKNNYEYILSDSVILKKFKNYYLFNIKENNYWIVILIEPINSSKLLLKTIHNYYFNFANPKNPDIKIIEKKEILKEIRKITKYKKIDKNTYLINPNESQLNKLIENDIFRDLIILEKID